MHAVDGYKYKSKAGVRDGSVRQASCYFKGVQHGFTRKLLWAARWIRWALPSHSFQSSENCFLMSTRHRARESVKYLCAFPPDLLS